jgi:hypothetical protein
VPLSLEQAFQRLPLATSGACDNQLDACMRLIESGKVNGQALANALLHRGIWLVLAGSCDGALIWPRTKTAAVTWLIDLAFDTSSCRPTSSITGVRYGLAFPVGRWRYACKKSSSESLHRVFTRFSA